MGGRSLHPWVEFAYMGGVCIHGWEEFAWMKGVCIHGWEELHGWGVCVGLPSMQSHTIQISIIVELEG